MSQKTEFEGRVSNGLVLLEVPSFMYPIDNDSHTYLDKHQFNGTIQKNMDEYCTGKSHEGLDSLFKIAKVGESVTFVKDGEYVKLANRVSPQFISEPSDGYPHGKLYMVVRWTDIVTAYESSAKCVAHFDYIDSEIDLSKAKELPDGKEL